MGRRDTIILENTLITGWGANGKALAKVDGLVVFVTGAVPGDTADLRVTRKKKSYMEAEVQRIVGASGIRIAGRFRRIGPAQTPRQGP